jgi:hypothetical protein
MKKLGYQTFSKWIDEGYDTLSDGKRMDSIIESIIQFDKEKNKISIYKDMKEVLIHNYNVLENNASKKPPYAFDEVNKIFSPSLLNYGKEQKKII